VFEKGDTIVRSMVQSTMGKKRDYTFKTNIWTQFPSALERSKMLNQGKVAGKTFGEECDSDIGDGTDNSDSDIEIQ
jgi:hypothetical protein